jgi:cell division protein FtsQ
MKRSKKNRRVKDEKFDDEAYINEMLYEDGHRPPQHKRKKKRQGVFLGLMTFILGIAILVFAFLLLFHIQKIDVKGNKYSTQNDVIGWLKEDKYAVNSVYAWWKFNHSDVKQLPVVNSSKVTLKNPWTIQITVKEKEIAGYIDYNEQYLYFDKDGTAVLASSDKLDHAAYLEGMDVDTGKVKLGKVLPVTDKDVFQGIVELSQLLVKYELNPDSITCSGSDLNLYFGKVEVLLGNTNYEERVAQISPILEKLNKQYPNSEGTLHLESYDTTDKAVRFVPKKEEEPTSGEDGETDGSDEETVQP